MQCSLVGLPHQALSQPTRTMTTAALALAASTLKPTFPPDRASLFRSPASALVNVRIFYLPAPTTSLLLLFPFLISLSILPWCNTHTWY